MVGRVWDLSTSIRRVPPPPPTPPADARVGGGVAQAQALPRRYVWPMQPLLPHGSGWWCAWGQRQQCYAQWSPGVMHDACHGGKSRIKLKLVSKSIYGKLNGKSHWRGCPVSIPYGESFLALGFAYPLFYSLQSGQRYPTLLQDS